jgi:hypothetical protein
MYFYIFPLEIELKSVYNQRKPISPHWFPLIIEKCCSIIVLATHEKVSLFLAGEVNISDCVILFKIDYPCFITFFFECLVLSFF